MRRHCDTCNRDYTHTEVTASGNDDTGERRHFIACSWLCVLYATVNAGIHLSLPAEPAYQ